MRIRGVMGNWNNTRVIEYLGGVTEYMGRKQVEGWKNTMLAGKTGGKTERGGPEKSRKA